MSLLLKIHKSQVNLVNGYWRLTVQWPSSHQINSILFKGAHNANPCSRTANQMHTELRQVRVLLQIFSQYDTLSINSPSSQKSKKINVELWAKYELTIIYVLILIFLGAPDIVRMGLQSIAWHCRTYTHWHLAEIQSGQRCTNQHILSSEYELDQKIKPGSFKAVLPTKTRWANSSI